MSEEIRLSTDVWGHVRAPQWTKNFLCRPLVGRLERRSQKCAAALTKPPLPPKAVTHTFTKKPPMGNRGATNPSVDFPQARSAEFNQVFVRIAEEKALAT